MFNACLQALVFVFTAVCAVVFLVGMYAVAHVMFTELAWQYAIFLLVSFVIVPFFGTIAGVLLIDDILERHK